LRCVNNVREKGVLGRIPSYMPQNCPCCGRTFFAAGSLVTQYKGWAEFVLNHQMLIIIVLWILSFTAGLGVLGHNVSGGHFGALMVAMIVIPVMLVEVVVANLPKERVLRCNSCDWDKAYSLKAESK